MRYSRRPEADCGSCRLGMARASAVPAGTDAPDAEGWYRQPAYCRRQRAALRSRRRRAHRAGAMSRASGSWMRPPSRRRVGHEGTSASVSSSGGGSRRRPRHGLPRNIVVFGAASSPREGRSQIASRSPHVRLSRRALGGAPAETETPGREIAGGNRRGGFFFCMEGNGTAPAVPCRSFFHFSAGGPQPAWLCLYRVPFE